MQRVSEVLAGLKMIFVLYAYVMAGTHRNSGHYCYSNVKDTVPIARVPALVEAV